MAGLGRLQMQPTRTCNRTLLLHGWNEIMKRLAFQASCQCIARQSCHLAAASYKIDSQIARSAFGTALAALRPSAA